MKNEVTAIALVVIFFACVEIVQAQTTTLRYRQIPSTAKSVSALHFNIAQRKGLFVREGINVEMVSVEDRVNGSEVFLDQDRAW